VPSSGACVCCLTLGWKSVVAFLHITFHSTELLISMSVRSTPRNRHTLPHTRPVQTMSLAGVSSTGTLRCHPPDLHCRVGVAQFETRIHVLKTHAILQRVDEFLCFVAVISIRLPWGAAQYIARTEIVFRLLMARVLTQHVPPYLQSSLRRAPRISCAQVRSFEIPSHRRRAAAEGLQPRAPTLPRATGSFE